MKVALLLKSDAGMYALDEDQLRTLVKYCHRGLMQAMKEAEPHEGKKTPPEWLEFDELLRFLRNPDRDSCCHYD